MNRRRRFKAKRRRAIRHYDKAIRAQLIHLVRKAKSVDFGDWKVPTEQFT
jgi:hypothetical protein